MRGFVFKIDLFAIRLCFQELFRFAAVPCLTSIFFSFFSLVQCLKREAFVSPRFDVAGGGALLVARRARQPHARPGGGDRSRGASLEKPRVIYSFVEKSGHICFGKIKFQKLPKGATVEGGSEGRRAQTSSRPAAPRGFASKETNVRIEKNQALFVTRALDSISRVSKFKNPQVST